MHMSLKRLALLKITGYVEKVKGVFTELMESFYFREIKTAKDRK